MRKDRTSDTGAERPDQSSTDGQTEPKRCNFIGALCFERNAPHWTCIGNRSRRYRCTYDPVSSVGDRSEITDHLRTNFMFVAGIIFKSLH